MMDTSNFKEVFESPKVKALTAQVAELELEVTRLRSVMADVIKAHGYTGGTPVEVMSTPFTPTVLNELIEKAGEVRLREALVESCMEVESCLDKDPRKTLSNLKDYWFTSGMAEQQSIIATNRIVELDLEVLTLRKALDTYFEPTLDAWKREHVMRQALSTPFTTTALPELIEKGI